MDVINEGGNAASPHCPAEGEVHVWRLSLRNDTARQLPIDVLSEEERQRADRFAFEKDRHLYTVTRSALRTLLGEYLAMAPEAVKFLYNRFGKPALDPRQNDRRLTFNVSHTKQFSLLAFGVGADLGIDIEHRSIEGVEDLAKTAFSQAEYDWLMELSSQDRVHAFLRLWTHKEAIVKALGCGLSVPLKEIALTLHVTEPLRLLRGAPEIPDVSDWSLHDLFVHREYSAALAVRARAVEVQLWDWR